MNSIYTVALFKPDAVRRKLVGPIITEIENSDLKLTTMKVATLLKAEAQQFYAEHMGREYFPDLVAFVTSGPIYAVVLTGPADVDVIARWRNLIGPSNPADRGPDTIRGRWAEGCPEMENLVHGSDSPMAAVREKAFLRQWGCL